MIITTNIKDSNGDFDTLDCSKIGCLITKDVEIRTATGASCVKFLSSFSHNEDERKIIYSLCDKDGKFITSACISDIRFATELSYNIHSDSISELDELHIVKQMKQECIEKLKLIEDFKKEIFYNDKYEDAVIFMMNKDKVIGVLESITIDMDIAADKEQFITDKNLMESFITHKIYAYKGCTYSIVDSRTNQPVLLERHFPEIQSVLDNYKTGLKGESWEMQAIEIIKEEDAQDEVELDFLDELF